MATIANNYVGNGSTVLYSFTFPYLRESDVKVTINSVSTTAYTFANATTLQFNVAPTNGAAIRIYRSTDDSTLLATFYPGSAIRSQDLNENFIQNLYVTQESANYAAGATTVSNTALATANSAASTASSATSTANTASTNASAAVATANTASTNASAAVTTANTASSNASTALSTANTAASNASTALSTANTAASNASTALATANTANTNASAAVSTANTANTNASAAVTTAGTASTNASTALSTANTANSKADQAITAVSNSINYTLIANVAGIPASPANDTYIEVGNSTGIESFTPLTGKPAGFVGDSGLSVRLRYTTAGATWNWQNYYPNNAETRYLKLSGGTLTGNITLAGAPSSSLHPATKLYTDTALSAKLDTTTAASTYQTQAGMSSYLTTATAASTYQTQAGMSSYLTTAAAGSTYAPLASPTFTGTPVVPGYLTTTSATSTYQTQAGMSSYLTTSAAGSTYAPLASPTFTGTVTIPAGASISGYAALATAQSFTKAQRGAITALTDGATITPDFSLGNNYSVTLGGSRTLANPTNLTAGQSGVIVITQDATGSRTLAYGSYWKFPGGTAPTLTTTASAVDVLAYYVESSTRITARLVSDVK